MTTPTNTKLSTADATTLKEVVDFCKNFGTDIVRLCPTRGVVAVDETPTIAVFPDIEYAGPELSVNRIKILAQRIVPDSVCSVYTNAAGTPHKLEIATKKSTVDFILPSVSAIRRIPAKFTGVFEHRITLPRTDFVAAVAGAKSMGATHLQLVHRSGKFDAVAFNMGEGFKYSLSPAQSLGEFAYEYSIDHLLAVDKFLNVEEVVLNITPRGQLMIEVEHRGLSAHVFIMHNIQR
jgi:hypothetical protein